MKLHYNNSEINFPARTLSADIKNVTSHHRINRNVVEFRHGIVLNLHCDGFQMADILKLLRENSLSEHIRSIEASSKNSDKDLSVYGSEKAPGIWIDDETYLTWREFEIMESLLKGWLNKEIADDLKLKYNTVRNNLQRIYRKFKVNNRSEAILYYLKIRDNLKIVTRGQ